MVDILQSLTARDCTHYYNVLTVVKGETRENKCYICEVELTDKNTYRGIVIKHAKCNICGIKIASYKKNKRSEYNSKTKKIESKKIKLSTYLTI